MAESRRAEQRLWLIVFQIKAIRTRLNLLAFQHWFFGTLGILGAIAAAVYFGAVILTPLVFLVIAVVACIVGLLGLLRVARAALRDSASPQRAAAVADTRARLKGRLTTVLALAETPPPSSLWTYLVEDTYALRHKFEPRAVEPRWLSRTILAPLLVLAIAFAALFALRIHRRSVATAGAAQPNEIVADLGNLEIRPASPSDPVTARIYADPATLRQLAARLAQAQNSQSPDTRVSRWINKARQLAGSLQDQLTGKKPLTLPPLMLKLRGDKLAQNRNDTSPAPRPGDHPGSPSDNAPVMPPGGPGGGPAANGAAQPPVTIPPADADRLAQNGITSIPGVTTGDSVGTPQDQPGPKTGSGYSSEAGSNHSAGSDPEHLFGPPSAEPLGSDTFKLSVDARPIDESSNGGAPAYLPPKVRVPLNPQQSADEPLARTSVPVDDRTTIKRVFER